MRLAVYTYFRNLHLINLRHEKGKRFYSDYDQLKPDSHDFSGPEQWLDISSEWAPEDEPSLKSSLQKDLILLPDFITEHEENEFMMELDPILRKMRYENDHWDNAIVGYCETERSQWSEICSGVLQRVVTAALGGERPLAAQHVLDLAASGHIAPHVDAVRFCGGVVAGLCLLSPAVMRLRHVAGPQRRADLLLPRRALYALRGVARYDFTHEVLPPASSQWRGRRVPRSRRVSVITRTVPDPARQDS